MNNNFLNLCEAGKLEEIKQYLSEKEDITVKDMFGRNALHIAALKGYTEIVQLLIDAGVPADEPDKDGETPLYKAGQNGFLDIAEIFIKNGANIYIK
ncbi:MAG TPA: ankyrin repeat domain-containing protein, partial [Defluviitaleaceae bacterium]|nr:ankyrin repeat domain-containing protein [Defluviitaleaceae bacterium]